MEEGFGQVSFKTFVLEMGLLSGLVMGCSTTMTADDFEHGLEGGRGVKFE